MKKVVNLFMFCLIGLLFINSKAMCLTNDKISISDLKKSVVDSKDGLYKDLYTNDRYIFKGSNPNNYVTLNGENAGWRIIAIESDGTLKLVHNGSIGSMSFDDINLRTQGFCAVNKAYLYGCSVWSKFDNYSNNRATGLVEDDSSLNKFLNNEYYNSLNEETRNLIISHDYNVGSVNRNESTVEAMLKNEGKYIWNGYVGLINPSDYIFSNSNTTLCGTLKKVFDKEKDCLETSYLSPKGKSYWTISNDITSTYFPLIVRDSGRVYNFHYSSEKNEVWPVVFIKSDIELSGLGTIDVPYIISEKEEVKDNNPSDNNEPIDDNKPSDNTTSSENTGENKAEESKTEDNSVTINKNEQLDDVPKTGDSVSILLISLCSLTLLSGLYLYNKFIKRI